MIHVSIRSAFTGTAILAKVAATAGCSDREIRQNQEAASPAFVTETGDTIHMKEGIRFGSLDGDVEYQFNNIIWLLARADGGVLVYDVGQGDQGGPIRQYDAGGRFIRSIGGQGEGPGEYDQFPMGTLLVDGSLLVADQGHARLTRFDTSGKVTGIWRGPTAIVDVGPSVDGGWFLSCVTGHPIGKPRRITYYRYSALGEVLDSAPAPAAYRDGPSGAPYGARAMTIVLPDGRFVSSRTDSIAFVIDGPAGSATYARASNRARFNEAEKQALARSYAAVDRRAGHGPQPVDIPDLKQAFWYMVSDPGGRILFLRRTAAFHIADTTGLRPTETPWRGTLEIDVFDSSSAYRGRLITPKDVQTRGFAFGPGRLWLTHEGASGELYLVRWQPARPAW